MAEVHKGHQDLYLTCLINDARTNTNCFSLDILLCPVDKSGRHYNHGIKEYTIICGMLQDSKMPRIKLTY